MSPRRQAPREDPREAIVQAAMRVFALHGYFRAPVHLIAREAGVSKGLIFWYFRTKDELILEAARRSLPGDIVEECLSTKGLDGRPLLECLGKRYMEKYSDPVLRGLMLHTLSAEEIYEPIRDEVKKICSSYIRKIAERAYGRSGPAERIRVRTFFGALLCYTLRKPDDIAPDEYLATLLDTIAPQ